MSITNQRLPVCITYFPNGLEAGSLGGKLSVPFLAVTTVIRERWEVGYAPCPVKERGVS